MLKNKIDFWQSVFYVSWSVLIIWIILNWIGAIKVSYFAEYKIPIISFTVGIFSAYHSILERFNRLEAVLQKYQNI